MTASKWISVAAGIWIQCSCGASYVFGIYSPILKSSQGYDQSTLDTISVFKDIGANAGVLAGLMYSYVCRRSSQRSPLQEPWVVHAAGAIQCFVGYFFMWLAVTGAIPRPHVALMCLFMFLAAHAQPFFNTANVVSSVQNFPAYSGTLVGIMKGYLGLSAAVLIQVYETLIPGKPAAFLLMLALVPTIISLLLMSLVRVHQPRSTDHEKRYLDFFAVNAVMVAIYLMILIFLSNIFASPPWLHGLTLALLLVLLSSPIIIAIKARNNDLQGHALSLMKESRCSKLEKLPLVENPAAEGIQEHNATATTSEARLDAGEEINLVKAMSTLNFWMLFVAVLCGMGSGLSTINNLSQAGESLGYTSRQISTLVSLWSIWNFLGRFGAGYISDALLRWKGWARPLFMALTLAAMTGGHIIIASGFSGNLFIGSILVGMCYGSQWSLMPTITSEIFGVAHMGTIYNTIAVASPLGSYILSVRVIGSIYDKEGPGTWKPCMGTHCFMLSFLILACVSLFGSFVAVALLINTRGIYARIVRGRRWG